MFRLFLFANLFFAVLSWAASPVGKIEAVQGRVYILDVKGQKVADPEGSQGRRATKIDCPFYVGESIQTAVGAKVKLRFIEGNNTIVLGSDTIFQIEKASSTEELLRQNKTSRFYLRQGELRSHVIEKYRVERGESFEITSPNAAAGVRGTIFYMNYSPQSKKTLLYTLEGLVHFSSRSVDKAQDVKAGQAFEVEFGKEASALTLNSEELQRMNELNAYSGEKSETDATPKGEPQKSNVPNSALERQESLSFANGY